MMRSLAEDRFLRQFGQRVRQERQRRGWTIYDLAELMGVSGAAISRWETGHDSCRAWAYHRLQQWIGS